MISSISFYYKQLLPLWIACDGIVLLIWAEWYSICEVLLFVKSSIIELITLSNAQL